MDCFTRCSRNMRKRFDYPTDLLSTGHHVTKRFFRLLACQLLLLLACGLPLPARAAGGVDINHFSIEAAEEGYRVLASYSFELNHDLEEAIQSGVKLYFTTEVVITRPRWYWTDQNAVTARRTIFIVFNTLTRQYHVGVVGMQQSLQQSYATLDEALFQIRRPNRWLIAPRGALKAGETYNVTLSMGMDRNYLPKPFQVNAFNNSDWRLASDKKTYQFRAD
jgi:hypothetical protein